MVLGGAQKFDSFNVYGTSASIRRRIAKGKGEGEGDGNIVKLENLLYSLFAIQILSLLDLVLNFLFT